MYEVLLNLFFSYIPPLIAIYAIGTDKYWKILPKKILIIAIVCFVIHFWFLNGLDSFSRASFWAVFGGFFLVGRGGAYFIW